MATLPKITPDANGVLAPPANQNNLNPQGKKVVFLIGNNAAAHAVLDQIIPSLANMGIHADVYFTNPPANARLQEKLAVPENRYFAFFEKLPLDVIHPILESRPMLLRGGEIDESLRYTARQLSEYYAERGIRINIETLDNPNDPAFVKRIEDDPDIVKGYNIRSMHILKPPLINAFNAKRYQPPQSQNVVNGGINNAHPGPLPRIPGTHTAFWGRMEGHSWSEWVLHQIDEGIDTGPILDTCAKPLGKDKTLLQDLMGMTEKSAQMIVTDIRLNFEGRPRPALPQNMLQRPTQNYTYPTHDEWLQAHARGIVAVEPWTYAEALATEYTGGRANAPELHEEIYPALLAAIIHWEDEYKQLYLKTYGHKPPPCPGDTVPAHVAGASADP